MRTKEVKFGVFSLKFVQLPSGIWVTPTKNVGLILGYTKSGQSLSDHISGKWSDEFTKFDRVTLDAIHLSEIRKFVPDLEANSANSMSFLTLSGVMKVILKSRSEVAELLRVEILAQIPDISNIPESSNLEQNMKTDIKKIENTEKTVTAKVEKKEVTTTPSQMPLALANKPQSDDPVSGLIYTLQVGKEWNTFSDAYITKTMRSLVNAQLKRVQAQAKAIKKEEPPTTSLAVQDRAASAKPATRNGNHGATQMVPISNIQASSGTPNFDSVRSFFLTGHEKHPDFQSYMSAEEIGKLIGKTADQMKDPIKKYINGLDHDLPNNMLREVVRSQGGYFRGIGYMVDKRGYPVFQIPNIGMTTWYLMEDGQVVWRNYWHPDAVRGILDSMGYITHLKDEVFTVSAKQKVIEGN